MTRIPERLRNDSIIEAILELRFDHTEAMPESAVTRFIDRAEWKEFRRSRLPLFEVPQQIRLADANLRAQPLVEITSHDQIRLIKFGTNVISFHNLTKYLGWNTQLKLELFAMVDFMFEKVDGIKIHRIGLRYINALTKEHHYIDSPHDLNIDVNWRGKKLECPFNLNFLIREDDLDTTMRIATKHLITGRVPENMTAYVDIDVATHDGFSSSSCDEVKLMIDTAHTREKTQFFGLLPDAIIEKLEERK